MTQLPKIPALKPLRAERREQKRRPKMAVHGRGVKQLPASGIVAAAKRVAR